MHAMDMINSSTIDKLLHFGTVWVLYLKCTSILLMIKFQYSLFILLLFFSKKNLILRKLIFSEASMFIIHN